MLTRDHDPFGKCTLWPGQKEQKEKSGSEFCVEGSFSLWTHACIRKTEMGIETGTSGQVVMDGFYDPARFINIDKLQGIGGSSNPKGFCAATMNSKHAGYVNKELG